MGKSALHIFILKHISTNFHFKTNFHIFVVCFVYISDEEKTKFDLVYTMCGYLLMGPL